MIEEWKAVPRYEGLYKVSNMGRVIGLKRNRILKSAPNEKGYQMVTLCKDGRMRTFKVHKLVAETFIGKKDGFEVNHIDGDKSNNQVNNLEYCSHSENVKHAIKTGLLVNRRAVLMMDSEGNILRQFDSITEAETVTNAKCITRACKTGIKAAGYRWKYL